MQQNDKAIISVVTFFVVNVSYKVSIFPKEEK